MRVLVTGGAGFIGSHLVDRLVADGHSVSVVDDLSTGRMENLGENESHVHFHRISTTSPLLLEILKKENPEIVFHLAAQINVRRSVLDPLNDANTNVLGSLNVLEACCRTGVKKIIFSSTGGAIYGETNRLPTLESEAPSPASPYGLSKYVVEQYLSLYSILKGLDHAILRYSNVYGHRQNPAGEAGVIAIFADAILHEKECVINGSGTQTRDYVFVKDVVEANVCAMRASGTYNIGTGRETSVMELFQAIQEIVNKTLGKKAGFVHAPAVKGEVARSCLDIRKARKELNWSPRTSLEQGLEETLQWFMSKK